MDASNDDDAELNSFLRTLSPVQIQQAQLPTTSPSLDQSSPSLGVPASTFHPSQQNSQSQAQQSASPFGLLASNMYQLIQGQPQNQEWWPSSSALGPVDRPVVGRNRGTGGEGFIPRPGFTMEEYANLITERIQNIPQNGNQNDSYNHTFRSSLSAPGDYREAGSGYATPSYASSYGSYQDDLGAFDGASSNGDHTVDSGYNLNGDEHDSKGDVANADFFSSFDNFSCQSLAQDPAELDVPLPSDSDNHQPGWPFNRPLTEQSSASHLSVNLHLSAPKRTSTMETDATICPEPPAPQIRMPPAHQSSLPSSHLSSFDFASDTLSAASPENLSGEPDVWPESPKGMSEKSFFEGDISSAHSKPEYGQSVPSHLVSGEIISNTSPLYSQSRTPNLASSPQNNSNYDFRSEPPVSSASGSTSSSPSRLNVQRSSLSNSALPPISITSSPSPSSTSSPSSSQQWSSPILQSPSENLNFSPTESDGQLFRNAGLHPPINSRLFNLNQMSPAEGSLGPNEHLQINIVPSTPTMGLAGTKMQPLNEFASAIPGASRNPVSGSSSTGSSPRARPPSATQVMSTQPRLVISSSIQQPQIHGSFDGHRSTTPTSPVPESSSFFPQVPSLTSNGSEEMSWLSGLENAATEPIRQSQMTVSLPQAGLSTLELSQGNSRPSPAPYSFFPSNTSFSSSLNLSHQPDPTGPTLPVSNQVSPFLKAPPQRQRSRSEASLIPYDFGPVPVPPTMNPNHLAKPGSSQPSLNLSTSPTQQQRNQIQQQRQQQQQQQQQQLLLLQQQIQSQLQKQQLQQQQSQLSQQFQFQIQPPHSDAQNANIVLTPFAGDPSPPLDAFQTLQMQQQMQRVNFYQSSSQPTASSSSSKPSSLVHHQPFDGKPRRTSFGGGTFGAGTPNYGHGLLNPWTEMYGVSAGEPATLGMPGPGVQRSLSDAGSNRTSHRKVKSIDLGSSSYLGVPNNSSRSPRYRSPSRPTSAASSSTTASASNSSSDVKSLPTSSYAGSTSYSGLSPTHNLVQMDMNMFDSDEDDEDTDPDGPPIMLTPLSEPSASSGTGGQEELNVRKQSVTTNKTANASKSRRKVDAHFVCPIPGCGTTFTRSFNLKGHLRSHTDERPFKCETCGKGFARQHDCKRHMALHVGYRPHSCVGCKKKFARLDALSRHLKSDAGQECLRVAGTSALASDTDPEASIEEKLEKIDYSGGSGSSSPPAERDPRMPTRGMSGVLL